MDIDNTAENTFECITWRTYVCDVSAFFLYFHYPHFCVQTHKFSQDVPFMGPYVRHTIKMKRHLYLLICTHVLKSFG